MTEQPAKKKLKLSQPYPVPAPEDQGANLQATQTQQPQIQMPYQMMNPMMYQMGVQQQQMWNAYQQPQLFPQTQMPAAQGAVKPNDPAGGKPKTQLKKGSEPYQSTKQEKAKQQVADDYFANLTTVENHVHQDQQSLFVNHPESLMQQIENDDEEMLGRDLSEEEMKRYIQTIPEEYLHQFEDEYLEHQIDEIMRDFDECEKFEERMKDCSCCKGYVYKCKGAICQSLGKCQCMVHEEMESQAQEDFIPECKDCKCCQGYVYTCLGEACKNKKACVCFADAIDE